MAPEEQINSLRYNPVNYAACDSEGLWDRPDQQLAAQRRLNIRVSRSKAVRKRVFEGQRHAHEGIVESIALSGATGGLWMLGEDSCEVNVDCS